MMTVIDFLYASAEKNPNKTAFEDQKGGVSYKGVLETATKIGSGLCKKLQTVNAPVAVLIDRNKESLITFLAVAMSHNFYVPVDISQPLERIKLIFDQLSPVATVSIGNLKPELADMMSCPVFDYSDLEKENADYELIAKIKEDVIDTDPLYAVCTSGSTGVPKAVLMSHRSILDWAPVFTGTFSLTEDDIFGNQAPFDYDGSVKDIYSSLYLGATVYIIPAICFVMPKLLMETLENKKITVIVWAVSALGIVAELDMLDYMVPTHLKKVLFSGEVMPIKILNKWREYLPDAMYVNLYGPTEVTCNCMYYIVDRDYSLEEKLPLGRAFKNECVMILNDKKEPIKEGESGEIYVRGSCLALGYYNDSERTKAAFIQNPLHDKYPDVVYTTGDIATLAEDGHYYFNARKDFQIKHMGHRIELEDIETHLNAIDSVKRAVCMYDKERKKIITFYAGTEECKEVLGKLKEKIPKFMIPNVAIKKATLPINKNGKIDKKALMAEYKETHAAK